MIPLKELHEMYRELGELETKLLKERWSQGKMDFGRGKEHYRLIGTAEDPIPDGEPGFLLRGQDHLAARAVEIYAVLAEAEGLYEVARNARAQSAKMADWLPKKRPDMGRDQSSRSDPVDWTAGGAGYVDARGGFYAGTPGPNAPMPHPTIPLKKGG